LFIKLQNYLLQKIFEGYITSIPEFYAIFPSANPYLDHVAIIDLTSKYSGIEYLYKIFNKIGFKQQGSGYLPEKQNDFIWMAANGSDTIIAEEALSQIIIADFRYNEFSKTTQNTLQKYTKYATGINFSYMDYLIEQYKINRNPKEAGDYIYNFLSSRQRPTPTVREFNIVREENQVAAWTLFFGRKANHFGFNINLLNRYKSLEDFNTYLKDDLNLTLNRDNGEIQGTAECGIQQSAMMGKSIKAQLSDGIIEINDSFMEFVWRYSSKKLPKYFSDYYTGFISSNADNIIKSIYTTTIRDK
jgi:hypothetical protein